MYTGTGNVVLVCLRHVDAREILKLSISQRVQVNRTNEIFSGVYCFETQVSEAAHLSWRCLEHAW